MKRTAWIALFVGALAFAGCNNPTNGDAHDHDHMEEHDHSHDGHDHSHGNGELEESPLDTLQGVGDTVAEDDTLVTD